jgi:hypothetical protein
MSSKETEEQFEAALTAIFMMDLKIWKGCHSINNRAVYRFKFFKKQV